MQLKCDTFSKDFLVIYTYCVLELLVNEMRLKNINIKLRHNN